MLPAAATGHDIVLINIDMPSDISTDPLVGFALTEALVERDPRERVLILTDVEGQEYVDRARRAGAAGYVSTSGSMKGLHDAINTVSAGGEYWPE